jgi:hypothetical protein
MSEDSAASALRSNARLVVIEAPAGCGKTHQGAKYAGDVAPLIGSQRIPGPHLPRRPDYLHRPREGSSPDAGCRPLQQRAWLSPRHRRAHREGSRRETDAQSRRAKPHRPLGPCHYSFAGNGKVVFVWQSRHPSPSITTVRLKVEENQLVDVFGEIGTRIEGLMGA